MYTPPTIVVFKVFTPVSESNWNTAPQAAIPGVSIGYLAFVFPIPRFLPTVTLPLNETSPITVVKSPLPIEEPDPELPPNVPSYLQKLIEGNPGNLFPPVKRRTPPSPSNTHG